MASIYTSDQYQILLDLSALLTAAMTDSIFSRTVSESLSTKLDRDQQFLFFTPAGSDNNYKASVSAAGIQILTTLDKKPTINLQFTKNTKYTTDAIKNTIENMNIEDKDEYANHYVSGTLPALKFDFTSQVPSIPVLTGTLSKHNTYEYSHKNLKDLENYYDRPYIDNLKNQLQQDIANVYTTLNIQKADDDADILAKLKSHIAATDCHGFDRYCTISKQQDDKAKLEQDLINHNNSQAAHPYIQGKIADNTKFINQVKTDYYRAHYSANYYSVFSQSEQNSQHKYLIAQSDPYTTASYLILNKNLTEYSDVGITIKNKQNLEFKMILTSNSNIYIDNISQDGTGTINFRQYNSAKTLKNQLTLMDNNGDTKLNRLRLNNPPRAYPPNIDTTYVPDIEWIKGYIESQLNKCIKAPDYSTYTDYTDIFNISHSMQLNFNAWVYISPNYFFSEFSFIGKLTYVYINGKPVCYTPAGSRAYVKDTYAYQSTDTHSVFIYVPANSTVSTDTDINATAVWYYRTL